MASEVHLQIRFCACSDSWKRLLQWGPEVFFKKVGHSRPLFIYFRLFNTVDNKQMLNKILPMTVVEPRTSGIESDCSTSWATTTSQRFLIIQIWREKSYQGCSLTAILHCAIYVWAALLIFYKLLYAKDTLQIVILFSSSQIRGI